VGGQRAGAAGRAGLARRAGAAGGQAGRAGGAGRRGGQAGLARRAGAAWCTVVSPGCRIAGRAEGCAWRPVDNPARVESKAPILQGFRAMRGLCARARGATRHFRALRGKQTFRPFYQQLTPGYRPPRQTNGNSRQVIDHHPRPPGALGRGAHAIGTVYRDAAQSRGTICNRASLSIITTPARPRSGRGRPPCSGIPPMADHCRRRAPADRRPVREADLPGRRGTI